MVIALISLVPILAVLIVAGALPGSRARRRLSPVPVRVRRAKAGKVRS